VAHARFDGEERPDAYVPPAELTGEHELRVTLVERAARPEAAEL